MADTAKYEAYRVQQPLVNDRNPSLFAPDMTDEQTRMASLTRAIEIGRESADRWKAGNPVAIQGGISFKVGYQEDFENYTYEDGEFKPSSGERTRLTDVFLDFSTGVMLIRRDTEAPSPFLVSQAFKQWLRQANGEMETGFSTIVQSIPMVENFLAALRAAENISRLTFVVHGPNPADDEDIVERLTAFSEENGIESASVTLHSESIDPTVAQRIAFAAAKMGDAVSATIRDFGSAAKRSIRMRKKPRAVEGPSAPNPDDGRELLDRFQRTLKDAGVGSDDGGGPET